MAAAVVGDCVVHSISHSLVSKSVSFLQAVPVPVTTSCFLSEIPFPHGSPFAHPVHAVHSNPWREQGLAVVVAVVVVLHSVLQICASNLGPLVQLVPVPVTTSLLRVCVPTTPH